MSPLARARARAGLRLPRLATHGLAATRGARRLSGVEPAQLFLLSADGLARLAPRGRHRGAKLLAVARDTRDVAAQCDGNKEAARGRRCHRHLLAFHGRFVGLYLRTPLHLEVSVFEYARTRGNYADRRLGRRHAP